MKKQILPLLLAASSLLLFAFSDASASHPAEKPDFVYSLTTEMNADGSSEITQELTLSKEILTFLKGMTGSPEGPICTAVNPDENGGVQWTEKESDNAVTCTARLEFADLKELADYIETEFSGAKFTRLEIVEGHFYYELEANLGDSYGLLSSLPYTLEVWWVLKVPGDVVETNADQTRGRTLTWNILEWNTSSPIRAESNLSAGAAGIDPALMTVGGILLLGCCCLGVLSAGGAGFFILRRKK